MVYHRKVVVRSLLFLRQGKNHVLSGARGRKRIALSSPWLEDTAASNRHGDVLMAIHLINRRHAFLRARQVVFPQNFAIILIVRTEFSIRRCSCKDQPSARCDDAASWRDAASSLALIAQGQHVAVRLLPNNPSRIQVVRGYLRPWWPNHRQPSDAFGSRSVVHEFVRNVIVHETFGPGGAGGMPFSRAMRRT